jgi:phosphate/sulfate permease
MGIFDGSVGMGTLSVLLLCLGIALAFEFVNGFHDTANAVATVIYTRTLKPGIAVLLSGMMNFLGVLIGGTAVAFSIVHLLPFDLLLNIGASVGIWMILSLLISAIVWNLGTWYFGIPASSSHTLIGSILGVGLASSYFSGQGLGNGVNWHKATEIGLSLLLSPLFGFCAAALLLLLCKALVKAPKLYQEPHGETPPPLWIRAILVLTCGTVSFAHGSNDGQKGMGLIMLILISTLPAQYALKPDFNAAELSKTTAIVREAKGMLTALAARQPDSGKIEKALSEVNALDAKLATVSDPLTLPKAERSELRADLVKADEALNKLLKADEVKLSKDEKDRLSDARKHINGVVDFVVYWVVLAVALALGIGTTVGWKRIVVTVGEKIGKTHLTYAQGAAAEIVAATTILLSTKYGLPVSTTHVLSSGIAGTMAANRSGLQAKTIRNIALAWILTLPVTMLLSGLLFALTAGGAIREMNAKPRTTTTNTTLTTQSK